jgi:hypothetical protein
MAVNCQRAAWKELHRLRETTLCGVGPRNCAAVRVWHNCRNTKHRISANFCGGNYSDGFGNTAFLRTFEVGTIVTGLKTHSLDIPHGNVLSTEESNRLAVLSFGTLYFTALRENELGHRSNALNFRLVSRPAPLCVYGNVVWEN